MAGRPRTMLKRLTDLCEKAKTLQEEIDNAIPRSIRHKGIEKSEWGGAANAAFETVFWLEDLMMETEWKVSESERAKERMDASRSRAEYTQSPGTGLEKAPVT